MSIFAQVWLWSLVAFVLGVLLTWLLLVRPAQTRVRELERKLVAHRSETVAARPEYGDARDTGRPDSAYLVEHEPTARPDYQADGVVRDDFEDIDDFEDGDPQPSNEPEQADPAVNGVFEPAGSDNTEYLPPVQARNDVEPQSYTGGVDSALNPDGIDSVDHVPADSRPAESHTGRGLFQPANPTSTGPAYEPPAEPAAEPASYQRPEPVEPVVDDGGPPTEALPKRQRKESPRGGFDPPQPVQPSMRTVTRREPTAGDATHSGSLFEPGESAAPTVGGQDITPGPSATGNGGAGGSLVGPFGPGSGMPLPGGAKPSEEFTVKASVTTLRYCPEDSPKFAEMVAEVWFRSSDDAERVGFRPIT